MRPIRLLLLQARLSGDPMREHEHRCFVRRTGLPSDAVRVHDLSDGPPGRDLLRRHDALSVGGSGDFYVSKGNVPHLEAFLEFLREIVERGHPTFASCFGFQSIVRALGGDVVHDPDRAEVGTFELTLTGEGRADPLFGQLPGRFMAQMGHKDRATRLAGPVVNLASSGRCRYQALRVADMPIWATQFHPELDRESNLDRFHRYLRDYGPSDPEQVSEALETFVESPEASDLLRRFLRLLFG